MFDDPKSKLKWLEEELLAAEEEELEEEYEDDPLEGLDPELLEELHLNSDDLTPGYNYAAEFSRMVYEDEEYDEEDYVEPEKKKGIKGLVLLAFLELLGIGIILAWWLKWMV